MTLKRWYGKCPDCPCLTRPNPQGIRNMTEATISRNSISIRVPFTRLQQLMDGSWRLGALEVRQRVKDPGVFAAELVAALNAEDEGGSTIVHKLFDTAINSAIENGAEGVENHTRQDT